MLRLAAAIAALILAAPAWAAGTTPAVNTDMGCVNTGDALQYTGAALGCGAPKRPSSTISTLGTTCTAGQAGQMYLVTDALAPVGLAVIVGGGAVKIGITCNGVNWIVQ